MKTNQTVLSFAWLAVFFITEMGFLTAQNAVSFDGDNDYITFGTADQLGSTVFTLEAWILKTGVGSATNTGSGGTVAVPVITKGRGESDSPANKNMNYFLGITTAGYLSADFEDKINGGNHPVTGTTVLSNNVWYHIAATYDGTTWRLYLNGNEETFLVIGPTFIPENTSIQHAGLGSAMNSTGVAAGFFAGVIDEARIWSVARSQSEIQAGMNSEILSATGLLGRWGMNEGAGTSANNSISGSPAGVLTNGPLWQVGAPAFNVAPLAPSELLVTSVSNTQQLVSWNDNSTNETGFGIEYSDSGIQGPFSFLVNVEANTGVYNSTGLSTMSEYCYRVYAVNSAGSSGFSNTGCAVTLNGPDALDLGTGSAYVTFGNNSALGLSTITIETWFKRNGTGSTANTGTGGATAIPLIAKGRGEEDNSNKDMNYFLGIRASDNVLVADFEEGASGTSPGLNHPVFGITPLMNNIWYHAAATYDGTTWHLYLNGNLEAELTVGQPLRSDCIQHASLGTAMNSTGVAAGHFDGILDEVRIWNYARSQSEIQLAVNQQIVSSEAGLVARWSLNEGDGTIINSSVLPPINGTIQNAGWEWVSGAPFNLSINHPPTSPTISVPVGGATGVSIPVDLGVTVSDQDGDILTVNFYGRPVMAALPTFSIIVLPDAQNYTSTVNGGTPAMFTAQTQWCIDNTVSRNIKYVSQLGDITNDNTTIAWENANSAMSLLDIIPPGLPYGIALGNHDFYSPPTKYGDYFPVSRFEGREYYGGHYGTNNENHYEFFSSGGLEFIVINLGSGNQNPTNDVLDWADALLKTHINKRAILVNHSILNAVTPSTFTGPGQVIYDELKDNPNLFLMLCGHNHGEEIREDTYNGNKIYSILSDYQTLENGGNGWLRIMEFDPSDNVIHISTYSPTLNQFNTGVKSQFDVEYIMQGNTFQLIGSSTGVASGSSANIAWPGLDPLTEYEWYVTVNDGIATTTSEVWTFTTEVETGNETSLSLNSLFPEGLYTGTGNLRKAQNSIGDQFSGNTADQITIELHDPTNYSTIIYSANNVNLSTTGVASLSIPAIFNGLYYITIKHRNSIEIVSALPISFAGGAISFTPDAPGKVYGGNILMADGYYLMYSGDLNQDGIVDPKDLLQAENRSSSFEMGYIPEDVNGDGMIDAADLVLIDNNASGFIAKIVPP